MTALHQLALQGFLVALTSALILVPLCAKIARRLGVVDKPGGRKIHANVTPLLGGVGVFLATAAGFATLALFEDNVDGFAMNLPQLKWVLTGSVIMFLVGLIDDVFKDSMAFQPKLLGQIAAIGVLMWPYLSTLIQNGGTAGQWAYQLFFLCWYLTIINSFNFSDNMNGLMSGLSVISFLAAVVYLGSSDSERSMVLAIVLCGGLLGFLPYNFPKSMIFLGDAGSMFVGFWMAWAQFDLSRGFLDVGPLLNMHHLLPAILIMGLPLYDAAFVIVMRAVDKRPIYLGDDQHLSHRLVRCGCTRTEAVVILWGLAIILAAVGIVAAFAEPLWQYLLFSLSFVFMLAVTRVVMRVEAKTKLSAPGTAELTDDHVAGEGGS